MNIINELMNYYNYYSKLMNYYNKLLMNNSNEY